MQFEKPTVIMFCGLPITGKTTTAELLQRALGDIHVADIDRIRKACFGEPHPRPETSEELLRKDGQEMAAAYDALFFTIEKHLAMGKSLIACCTLSSKKHGQDRLEDLLSRYPNAALKVIWLKLDDERAMRRRFAERKFGEEYAGATNSPERWLFLQSRYNPIELPHLSLDTSARSSEVCADLVNAYILCA